MLKRLFFLGAALAVTTPALHAQQVVVDTLIQPFPTFFDAFGYDLDVGPGGDGRSRLLIGTPDEDASGRAHVFVYDEDSGWWKHEERMPNGGGELGHRVAFAGGDDTMGWPDLAIAGAPDYVFGSNDKGATFIFAREPSTSMWALDTLLTGNPPQFWARFGNTVALTYLSSGEALAVVGEPNGGTDPSGGVREGRVYVFRRSPETNTWTFETRLWNPEPAANGGFGLALTLISTPGLSGGHEGDALLLVVGAPPDGDPIVYALRRDGATRSWTHEAAFAPATYPPFAFFNNLRVRSLIPLPGGQPGEALALIGSSRDDETASNAGAAYVFRREADGSGGFTWIEEAKLLPTIPRINASWGTGLSLAPGPFVRAPRDSGVGESGVARALIGTDPAHPVEGHPGTADLFERRLDPDTGQPVWTPVAHFETGEVGFCCGDQFGAATALYGEQAFIGAYYSNAAEEMGFPLGEGAGAVFVYEPGVPTAVEPEALPEGEGFALTVSPNPVRGQATVTMALGRSQSVRVAVYDVLGREVASIHDGPLAAGTQTVEWHSQSLAPGVYIVRAEGEAGKATQTVTVLR